MKKIIILFYWICFLLSSPAAFAQEIDAPTVSTWHHKMETDFYIWKNDFLFLPIYSIDKDWLHLEGRYNWEDINTFSGWVGYNFNGGNKFEYTITPMLGGIVGNTDGIAPGLEIDLQYYGVEFSSQSEYVIDFSGRKNDYYYSWTDLSYSPLDWFWFGLSMQRTRIHLNPEEFQFGLMAGGGYKSLGLTSYLYSLGSDDPCLIIALTLELPNQ